MLRARGRAVGYLFWGLGLIGALALLAPLPRTRLTASLDSSYTAVLSFAAVHHLQFGTEIIFTYGPLAHLFMGIFDPHLLTADVWGNLALKAVYLVAMFLVSRRLHPVRRGFFILAAFLAAFFSFQAMFILLLVAAAWTAFTWERNFPALTIPLLFAGAAAALIKATFLCYGALVLVLGLGFLVLRRDFRRIAQVLPVAIVAFLSFWLIAGQHFSNLWPYFSSSIAMVSGYANAMSLIPRPAILIAGLIALTAGITQLATALFRHRSSAAAWFLTFILAAALFIAWKLGYSRADAHTVELFYFEILMLLALPAFLPAARGVGARIFDYTLLAVVVGLGLFVIVDQIGFLLPKFERAIAERIRFTATALISPARVIARYESDLRKNAEALQLPIIKQRVGHGSVDVFGYEQAVAIANDLHYTPRPVFQGYLTYTPALAEVNVAFYRSPRAPRFVIFKLQAIDARLPALDDADLLPILARDYEIVLHEKGYLLLEHRRIGSPINRSTVTTAKASLGKFVSVPRPPVWCRVRFRETLLARIFGFFYQEPQLWVGFTTRDHQALSYRLPATMAAHGFLLNPLLRNTEDFEAFVKGQSAGVNLKTMKTTAQPAFPSLVHGRVTYEFSK